MTTANSNATPMLLASGSEEVLSFYSNEGITWKYTTAMAPW